MVGLAVLIMTPDRLVGSVCNIGASHNDKISPIGKIVQSLFRINVIG